jgi:beta-galactosidase/beta-glucuronidase
LERLSASHILNEKMTRKNSQWTRFLIPAIMLICSFGGLKAQFDNPTQTIPRPEHPRPQFIRDQWMNLNGEWNFSFDFDREGEKKGWAEDPSSFESKILVPFCPESKQSGVENTDLIPAIWYHRTVTIPKEWKGKRVFLHFGAVDYDCRAWINGELAGRHYGGGVSFEFEITRFLRDGISDIVVCALDDVTSGLQPLGKQTPYVYDPNKWTTRYMRTTGIWQTVWMEARPDNFIRSVTIKPDIDNDRFILEPLFDNIDREAIFRAILLTGEGKEIQVVNSKLINGIPVAVDVKDARLWHPAHPYLYQFRFQLVKNGEVRDHVDSYAGLRKIHIEGNKIYLNNELLYLRFVLDQGFYPDGIWTAPSDAELKADIELSMAVGFNGARLHQKVFEERFHYWADKLGYLTMGEFYDFGMDWEKPQCIFNHQREWREIVLRDLNHPSIIAWTPFNETIGGARKDMEIHRRTIYDIMDLTRTLDPTRPVHSVSGYVQVQTDIYSDHNYHQDAELLKRNYAELTPESSWQENYTVAAGLSVPYEGQPFFVAEYSGTFWDTQETIPDDADKWGYGKGVRTEIENKLAANRWVRTAFKPTSETIEDAIGKQTQAILGHAHISGFCFTQLTDIEGEVNGIYTYDRKLKFDTQRMRKIFSAPAMIEKQ